MASEFTPLTQEERETAELFYKTTSSPNAAEKFPRRLWEHIQILTGRNEALSAHYRVAANLAETYKNWSNNLAKPLIEAMLHGTRITSDGIGKILDLHIGPGDDCPACGVPSPCPTRQVIADMGNKLEGQTAIIQKLTGETP